jgi:hypothetical protein
VAKSKKKNPGWSAPKLPDLGPVGWLAVAGVGFLALKAMKGRQEQQPFGPGGPQQAYGAATGPNSQEPHHLVVQDEGNPAYGGGLMGMGPNGIPIVALPSASANNSRSITSMRPTVPGITPQGRGGVEVDSGPAEVHPYAGESFGGMGMAGGGENF